MGENATPQVRLDRVLLRIFLSLKKEDFPAELRSRYEQALGIATRNGELSLESLQTLTDEGAEKLVSVAWDVLGLG
jgi:hypothetical protein